MNKSLATNLIALAMTLAGYVSPAYGEILFSTGVFALSGAVTNWLAIHMLFEKVPFLYGSGVIPARFEEFRAGIRQLIVQEFFTREHIERFFNRGEVMRSGIAERIDYDRAFDGLLVALEESSLGGMLGMIGGRKALMPLREPVTHKLRSIVEELAVSHTTGEEGSALTDALIEQVEHIIDSRLEELTPQKVKQIVQDMIRRHLGWLVVWGGVFGGAIGLAVSVAGM